MNQFQNTYIIYISVRFVLFNSIIIAQKVTYILIRHYVHTYTRLYSTYIRITYGM